MTEKLKQLLHERSDAVDFAMPDIDALTRAGDRRIRRRGAALVAGGLAAAVVTATVLVPQLRGGADPVPVVDVPATDAVSWAKGDVIHVGDRTVDVGHEVWAYARTTRGYVVADRGGTVWSVTDSGISSVGTVSAKHPRIVTDTDGTLAGWVDPSGESPDFVVLDQATGDVVREDGETTPDMGELADEENPAYIYAIDGRTAYWRDARGAVAVDVDSGEVRVVDAQARNGFDIIAAEDDLVAVSRQRGTQIGQGPDDVVAMLREVYGSMGAFSPDAHFYTADADEPQVYDVSTGTRVGLDLDRGFATGYEWLDSETLVVLAAAEAENSAEAELLTCSVTSGECTPVAAELGTFDDMVESVALPVGERLGG